MKLPLLLMISTSLLIIQATADLTSDIAKFTSTISALNENDVDAIQGLRRVAENAKILLSLGEPMGALIVAGFDQTFNPDSEEQSALENLNNYMNSFYQMQNQTSNDVSMDPAFRRIRGEYTTKVQVSLVNIWSEFLNVILPNVARQGFKSGFLDECQRNDPPKGVLRYIYKMFYENCGALSTKEGLKRSIQAQKAFQNIESSLEPSSHYLFKYYYEIKRKILKFIKTTNESTSLEMLKKLESVKAKSPSELESKFKELGLMNDSVWAVKDCALDIAFEANEHRRSDANSVLGDLTFDILKAQILFSACNNASNEGNETAMDADRKEARDMVELVGNYIVDYMNNSLHMDWPTYTLEAVKTKFGSQTFGVSQYAEKVEEIWHLVENYGPNNKGYQVILTEHNEDLEYAVRTLDDRRYAKIMNMNGVNVHIFQYDLDEPDRIRNASEWFKEHYSEMAQEVVEHWKVSVQEMMATLVEKYEFLEASRHHSLLILKKKAFWEPNSIINSAVTSVPSYNGTSRLLYCHNEWYEFAYCWHIYAIL